MVQEEEKGFGCFGTIFLAAFFALIVGGGTNYFFGTGTVEFGDVFIWTFIVVLGLGAIVKTTAILNNNKLKKASKIEAERIIAEEEENTKDK